MIGKRFGNILFVLVVVFMVRESIAEGIVGDPYYLATDPVTGAALGDQPKVIVHEGREIRFANEQTLETFKKDPASTIAKLDQLLIAEQLKNYTYPDCVVSGEKLGGMGEPVNGIYHNRLLRFCCKSCVKRAEKKFDEIKIKLDQSVIDAQLAKYPLKECIVTGRPLDQNAVNHVVGTRLVRLANQDAVKEFSANPAKYLAKLSASH